MVDIIRMEWTDCDLSVSSIRRVLEHYPSGILCHIQLVLPNDPVDLVGRGRLPCEVDVGGV